MHMAASMRATAWHHHLGMVGLMSFFRNSCHDSLSSLFANVMVIFWPLDEPRNFDYSGTISCPNPSLLSCSKIQPSGSLILTPYVSCGEGLRKMSCKLNLSNWQTISAPLMTSGKSA